MLNSARVTTSQPISNGVGCFMVTQKTTETAPAGQNSGKEWFVYRREKRTGRIAIAGNGEPMTIEEATQFHWAHTGCVGERHNSYFVHKGRIA